MTSLASEVRQRRRSLSLTQEQAAELADVSVSTWGNIETGRLTDPSPTSAAGVARALRWPANFLEMVAAGQSPSADRTLAIDGAEMLVLLRQNDPESYAAVLTLLRSLTRRYVS